MSSPGAMTYGQHNTATTALGLLLAVALFINITKVLLGSKFLLIGADVLVVLFAMAACFIYASRSLYIGLLELLLISFVLLGIAQIFNPNVPSFQVGLEAFRRLAFPLLGLLIGIAFVSTKAQIIRLWKILAICAVPILLYALKQFFVMSEFDNAFIESNTADIDTWRIFGKMRAFGIFNGPFHLGIFSCIIFWVAIALRLETGKRRYSALAALAGLACIASLTRASLIALIASVPIAAFVAFRGQRTQVIRKTLVTIVSVAVACAVVYYSSSTVRSVVEGYSMVESLQEDGRLQGRFEGYADALKILADHPLGAGMASASDATGIYFEQKNLVHVTSHNIWLWVLVETGAVGLLLFAAIIGLLAATVHYLAKRNERSIGLAAGGSLTAVLIAGLTGSTLSAYPVNLIFWLLFGAYIGYLRAQIANRETANG